MTVAGFVFQHFLAEAIESVLLVNFMEISVSGICRARQMRLTLPSCREAGPCFPFRPLLVR